MAVFGDIAILTGCNGALAFNASHCRGMQRFTGIAVMSAFATMYCTCSDVRACAITILFAIGACRLTLLALLALFAIADILGLRVIHHAID